LVISKIEAGDVGAGLQKLIDEKVPEKLEIELENNNGETKKIEIDFQ